MVGDDLPARAIVRREHLRTILRPSKGFHGRRIDDHEWRFHLECGHSVTLLLKRGRGGRKPMDPDKTEALRCPVCRPG